MQSLVDLFSLEAKETEIMTSDGLLNIAVLDAAIGSTDNHTSDASTAVNYFYNSKQFVKGMSVNQDELKMHFNWKNRPLNSMNDYDPQTLSTLYKSINAARTLTIVQIIRFILPPLRPEKDYSKCIANEFGTIETFTGYFDNPSKCKLKCCLCFICR